MNVPLIIGLLFFILGAMLIVKLIKKMISLAFSLAGLVIIVFVAIGILSAVDRAQINEEFPISKNLFLLHENGEVLTGYSTHPFAAIPDDELITVNDQINTDPNELVGDNYKLVIVPITTIEELDAENDALEMFRSGESSEEKAEVFKQVMETSMLQDDPAGNLIDNSKDGNIEVYKNTIALWRFWI